MKSKTGIKIIGSGSFVPEKVLTNKQLEQMVDTSDEWITQRTGIKERRIATKEMATSDLATKAAEIAIADAKIAVDEIDLIIVATVTADMLFPSCACIVQKNLGAHKAAAFDVQAACTGFIYGLSIARNFLWSKQYKTILLIGAESLTKITNWEDRSTCVLFGDGAGAVILRSMNTSAGILSVLLGSDGRYGELLRVPAGGSRMPACIQTITDKLHFIQMDGNAIFKLAVSHMYDAAKKALELCSVSCSDLALIIPHQANLRIIQALAHKLKIPMEKVFLNIHKYGNISSATTVIGIDEARKIGRIKDGDIIELVAFGSGLTWGACTIRL
ncbi:MAG: beta-ketoacyl-ACP synthase III [Elusimicrobia bacterium]|nr:beta-ketoacyl-ACP synthase III [Elusimicrobiota bacterium]